MNPRRHRLTIEEGPGRDYRAHCACGWVSGPPQENRDLLQQRYALHLLKLSNPVGQASDA